MIAKTSDVRSGTGQMAQAPDGDDVSTRLTLYNVPDRPLSIAEVAQIMSIGRTITVQAVYKWISHGVKIKRGRPERVMLQSSRMPSCIVVMPQALHDFIAELNGDTSVRQRRMTEAESLSEQRERRGLSAHVPG